MERRALHNLRLVNAQRQTLGQRLIFGGLGVQLASIVIITQVAHPSRLGFAAAMAAIAGTLAYVAGLAVYARAKGQSAAWCVLGLFSIVGLTVVLALPDLE